jgi:hypothetical protein
MASIADIVADMRTSPAGVRFSDLEKVCTHYFGAPRQRSTSHMIFKMPWAGDPRINIQPAKGGKAKAYQVKQVLQAIDRVTETDNGQ